MGITEERIKRITEQAAAMKAIGKASVDISGELESLAFDNAAMKTEIRGLEEANARLRERLNRGENHDAYMKLPLDADGVPIRIGDKMNIDGDAMTVFGYRLHDDMLLLVTEDKKSGLFFTPEPSRVRHFKPEPADSWEKLEEDVMKATTCLYFGDVESTVKCWDCPHGFEQSGTPCWKNEYIDILKRAKKLAGIEGEAQR